MNVLQKVVIPKIIHAISYIMYELEEQEREETFRLKRFKNSKARKANRAREERISDANKKIEQEPNIREISLQEEPNITEISVKDEHQGKEIQAEVKGDLTVPEFDRLTGKFMCTYCKMAAEILVTGQETKTNTVPCQTCVTDYENKDRIEHLLSHVNQVLKMTDTIIGTQNRASDLTSERKEELFSYTTIRETLENSPYSALCTCPHKLVKLFLPEGKEVLRKPKDVSEQLEEPCLCEPSHQPENPCPCYSPVLSKHSCSCLSLENLTSDFSQLPTIPYLPITSHSVPLSYPDCSAELASRILKASKPYLKDLEAIGYPICQDDVAKRIANASAPYFKFMLTNHSKEQKGSHFSKEAAAYFTRVPQGFTPFRPYIREETPGPSNFESTRLTSFKDPKTMVPKHTRVSDTQEGTTRNTGVTAKSNTISTSANDIAIYYSVQNHTHFRPYTREGVPGPSGINEVVHTVLNNTANSTRNYISYTREGRPGPCGITELNSIPDTKDAENHVTVISQQKAAYTRQGWPGPCGIDKTNPKNGNTERTVVFPISKSYTREGRPGPCGITGTYDKSTEKKIEDNLTSFLSVPQGKLDALNGIYEMKKTCDSVAISNTRYQVDGHEKIGAPSKKSATLRTAIATSPYTREGQPGPCGVFKILEQRQPGSQNLKNTSENLNIFALPRITRENKLRPTDLYDTYDITRPNIKKTPIPEKLLVCVSIVPQNGVSPIPEMEEQIGVRGINKPNNSLDSTDIATDVIVFKRVNIPTEPYTREGKSGPCGITEQDTVRYVPDLSNKEVYSSCNTVASRYASILPAIRFKVAEAAANLVKSGALNNNGADYLKATVSCHLGGLKASNDYLQSKDSPACDCKKSSHFKLFSKSFIKYLKVKTCPICRKPSAVHSTFPDFCNCDQSSDSERKPYVPGWIIPMRTATPTDASCKPCTVCKGPVHSTRSTPSIRSYANGYCLNFHNVTQKASKLSKSTKANESDKGISNGETQSGRCTPSEKSDANGYCINFNWAMSETASKTSKTSKHSTHKKPSVTSKHSKDSASKKALATAKSSKDKMEFGYFETEFKEIVKVSRFKNEDGTITDEKQTITIRTEKKYPKKPSDEAKLERETCLSSLQDYDLRSLEVGKKISPSKPCRNSKSEIIKVKTDIEPYPKIRLCISDHKFNYDAGTDLEIIMDKGPLSIPIGELESKTKKNSEARPDKVQRSNNNYLVLPKKPIQISPEPPISSSPLCVCHKIVTEDGANCSCEKIFLSYMNTDPACVCPDGSPCVTGPVCANRQTDTDSGPKCDCAEKSAKEKHTHEKPCTYLVGSTDLSAKLVCGNRDKDTDSGPKCSCADKKPAIDTPEGSKYSDTLCTCTSESVNSSTDRSYGKKRNISPSETYCDCPEGSPCMTTPECANRLKDTDSGPKCDCADISTNMSDIDKGDLVFCSCLEESPCITVPVCANRDKDTESGPKCNCVDETTSMNNRSVNPYRKEGGRVKCDGEQAMSNIAAPKFQQSAKMLDNIINGPGKDIIKRILPIAVTQSCRPKSDDKSRPLIVKSGGQLKELFPAGTQSVGCCPMSSDVTTVSEFSGNSVFLDPKDKRCCKNRKKTINGTVPCCLKSCPGEQSCPDRSKKKRFNNCTSTTELTSCFVPPKGPIPDDEWKAPQYTQKVEVTSSYCAIRIIRDGQNTCTDGNNEEEIVLTDSVVDTLRKMLKVEPPSSRIPCIRKDYKNICKTCYSPLSSSDSESYACPQCLYNEGRMQNENLERLRVNYDINPDCISMNSVNSYRRFLFKGFKGKNRCCPVNIDIRTPVSSHDVCSVPKGENSTSSKNPDSQNSAHHSDQKALYSGHIYNFFKW